MIIVVNDASLLIDLLKIDLSEEFFRLPFDMHTTDLVSAEITDENAERFQQYIKKKMIQIRNFSNEEWEEVLEIKADYLSLSFADCSCLWLCEKLLIMSYHLAIKLANSWRFKSYLQISINSSRPSVRNLLYLQ